MWPTFALRRFRPCEGTGKYADVVIENFKVGGLAKFGLDYASLSATNPKMIYASVTGFGQTGPYAIVRAMIL